MRAIHKFQQPVRHLWGCDIPSCHNIGVLCKITWAHLTFSLIIFLQTRFQPPSQLLFSLAVCEIIRISEEITLQLFSLLLLVRFSFLILQRWRLKSWCNTRHPSFCFFWYFIFAYEQIVLVIPLHFSSHGYPCHTPIWNALSFLGNQNHCELRIQMCVQIFYLEPIYWKSSIFYFPFFYNFQNCHVIRNQVANTLWS